MKLLFDKMIEEFGLEKVTEYCEMNQAACRISNSILIADGKPQNMSVKADEEWWEDKAYVLKHLNDEKN